MYRYYLALILLSLSACQMVYYVEPNGEQNFVKSWNYDTAPVIDCEDHANYLYWQLVEDGKRPKFVYLESKQVYQADHALIEIDGKWIDSFRGVNRHVSKKHYLRHYTVLAKFTHHDNIPELLPRSYAKEWQEHLAMEKHYRYWMD